MAANLKWTLRVAQKDQGSCFFGQCPHPLSTNVLSSESQSPQSSHPHFYIFDGKKVEAIRDHLLILFPTSTDPHTAAPCLPSLMLYGERWPPGRPKAKPGLETESVCPHTLSEFRITPAAKRILSHLPGPTIISQESSQVQAQFKARSHVASWLWSTCGCLGFCGLVPSVGPPAYPPCTCLKGTLDQPGPSHVPSP